MLTLYSFILPAILLNLDDNVFNYIMLLDKKYMLYRFVFISVFLLFQSISFSQIEIGGRINIGASEISNNFSDTDVEHNVEYGPSFLIGAYLDKTLKNNTSLSAELILQYFSGSENSITIFYDGNGERVGNRNGQDSKHITYLSLPLYYGIKMGFLTVNAGAQVGVVIGSGGRSTANGFNGGTPIFYNNPLDKLLIDKLTFGPRLGFLMKISETVAIDGNYYYGLNNIANSEIPWEWKVQQFSFGIRYQFLKKE